MNNKLPVLTPLSPIYAPVRRQMRLNQVLLIAYIVGALLFSLTMLALLATPDSFPEADSSFFGLIAHFLTLLIFLLQIMFVSIALTFSLWLYRAFNNLLALGVEVRYLPEQAVAWFLVPFANIVMPFFVLRELRQASDPANIKVHSRTNKFPFTIVGWWLFWILVFLVYPTFLVNAAVTIIVFELFMAVLAAFLLRIMTDITMRQDELHSLAHGSS